MCVIIICPEKVRPDADTLRQCWEANPHGAGISWRERGEVHWIKTNYLPELCDLAARKRGEIVLHFRIASVGGVCDALRHPFPISKRAGLADKGTAKAVLFQNGTWSAWHTYLEAARVKGHEIPQGQMSDTRAAAFLVSLYGKAFLDRCEGSRWVFYGATTTSLFGTWHKWHDMLFSNMWWQPRRIFADLPDDDDPDAGCCDVDANIPANTPKRTQSELELWDMTAATSYWDKLKKSCPKPVKTARKHPYENI